MDEVVFLGCKLKRIMVVDVVSVVLFRVHRRLVVVVVVDGHFLSWLGSFSMLIGCGKDKRDSV
ncbi:hypothetical protein A2U01_0051483 [Trifolium medium]|uniref:Transmembrane protein n=1 Tax=Trifolium medium TaxID=97028 RepID=A0A392R2C8_9FABA|nr:hypothetical protein [Trifolium medium]